jgi:DNA-binding response OmpR family regulator
MDVVALFGGRRYDMSQQKRILLVEDERSIQQILCFFLRHHDFEVLAVSNGLAAIQVIPEFQPHLIILDLVMHPGTGWDVLHWLRANLFIPRVPVLVISALVHVAEQMQGFEEGAIEYITKPTQPSRIVERVSALLSLDIEELAVLQHKHMDEQRKTLQRLAVEQPDEFAY